MCVRTFLLVACMLAWAAAISHAGAGELGDVPRGGFRSPEGDPRFRPEAGAKPLNNLVFELLNVASPGSSKHNFRNPREGWVYIRVTPKGDKRPAAVILDNKEVRLKMVNGHLEAMCHVPTDGHR